ncbi:MAG: tetratricopeptide repeat protein [Acidobacteriota bacterium]|nr:tetratricopeptide repeat protein [Acidobacteriota bacterium]
MKPLLHNLLRTAWAAATFATILGTLLLAAEPAGAQSSPPVSQTQRPAAEEATPQRAGMLERLRFNTRERTQRGLAALEDERPTEALQPFRTAGRLAPEDAWVQFNTGTAELQDPEPQAGAKRSLPSLSFAAENATEELAPIAHYNLGTAHLSADDPAAAVEALKNSLRADPSNPDAKVNLEVALRELEKRKQEKEQQQESEEQSEKDSEENKEPGDDQNQQQEPGEEPSPEQPDDQNEEKPGEDEPQEQSPDFEEQPDMSAEQAAAILEAVENLEREQRRLEAAEKARKASKQGKDW